MRCDLPSAAAIFFKVPPISRTHLLRKWWALWQAHVSLCCLLQGMGLPSQTAATISGLKADLREAQAKHAAQLAELQRRHEQQLQALRQEHSEMVNGLLETQRERRAGPAAPAAAELAALQQQVEMLQRRLDMAAAERDAAVGEVRAEMQAALHAKDEEYHRMLMVRGCFFGGEWMVVGLGQLHCPRGPPCRWCQWTGKAFFIWGHRQFLAQCWLQALSGCKLAVAGRVTWTFYLLSLTTRFSFAGQGFGDLLARGGAPAAGPGAAHHQGHDIAGENTLSRHRRGHRAKRPASAAATTAAAAAAAGPFVSRGHLTCPCALTTWAAAWSHSFGRASA